LSQDAEVEILRRILLRASRYGGQALLRMTTLFFIVLVDAKPSEFLQVLPALLNLQPEC
jgi:hypothetical protein